MPAAVQRSAISPGCQRLTARLLRRTHSIIDSQGLVDTSARLKRALDREPGERERLFQPFEQGAGGAGVAALHFAGERLQALAGALVLVVGPGGAEPAVDGRPVALGHVLEYVALLVAETALDGRLAEEVADRLPQRLGAVEEDLARFGNDVQHRGEGTRGSAVSAGGPRLAGRPISASAAETAAVTPAASSA